jgi:hypothetical protein
MIRNTNRAHESTTINIKNPGKHNHKHQQSPRKHDNKHQQNLKEQQACTPTKPKENMTMNNTNSEQEHEGHTMKNENRNCALQNPPSPSLPSSWLLPQVYKQHKEKLISSSSSNTNGIEENNDHEHQQSSRKHDHEHQ